LPNVEIVSSELVDTPIDLFSHIRIVEGVINTTEGAKRRFDINVTKIRKNTTISLATSSDVLPSKLPNSVSMG